MIATVRRTADLDQVDPTVVSHAIALDTGDPAAAIRAYAPRGVDRIIEVALSDNADLDNAVAANNAIIAAYATRADRTEIPFWPLLFNNVTLRLLGSDDFPAEARRQAARDLTSTAAVGALTVAVADRYPLDDIAKAHDHVDAAWWPRPHSAHHPPIAQTLNTALLNCPALCGRPPRCQVFGPVPAGEGGPAFGCLGVDAEQVGNDQALANAAKHPVRMARSISNRHRSDRTVIGW